MASGAGLKTRRDKVAPQALLVPRRESLADLADRVMTLIYGPHAETALMHRLMHQPTASNSGDQLVGDDVEVVALVKSQIVRALAACQIVVALDFDFSSFDKRTDHHFAKSELMYSDDDNKFDYEKEWVLAPHFWSMPNAADAISWSKSTVVVPTTFIYEGHSALEIVPFYKQARPLSMYFSNLPSSISVKAYVANPDVALRRFFKFGPLPSAQQANEYRSSIDNLVKEATAAAWRYLATTGSGRDFNQRDLFRHMISYLKSRNLYDEENERPSQGVLLAVAGKVHKQFQMEVEAVMSQPVYVSSTPTGGMAATTSNRQVGRKRKALAKPPKT